MGTSSGRQAPVGKLWRPAKTAAVRYASGQGAAPEAVRELVAHYCTAQVSLLQTDGATKSVLPALVPTAVALGTFYKIWEAEGCQTALVQAGVPRDSEQTWETLIPALLAALAGDGATLTEAIARAALLEHLEGVWLLGNALSSPPELLAEPPPAAGEGVRHFLGLALYRGLLADLGEILEFHAADVSQGVARQTDLKAYILSALLDWPTTIPASDTWSAAQAAALLQEMLTYLAGCHGR